MNPSFNKPFTFDRAIRLLIGIAIGVMLFLLIRKLSGALLPFLIALLFAYMIFPIVKFFQYKLRVKFRIIAIILTLATIFGTIALFIWALTPLIRYEYLEVHRLLTNFIEDNTDFRSLLPEEWITFIKSKLALIDTQNLFTTQNIMLFVENMSAQLWRVVAGSLHILISLFIVFIIFMYIFFILLDYETLENGWASFVPEKYRHFAVQLASDVQNGMNKYFRSQALIASIVGILFATGFKIIDFPLGITLGLFMGMLNMVPYLQTVGLFPMIILAAIKAGSLNENFFLIFLSALIVLAVVQVIQDMFLVPKIMGNTTGLKPAVILLSLSIWGVLLGVVGMIIALPMTTLVSSYYKRFILGEVEVVAKETEGEGRREKGERRKKIKERKEGTE